MRTDAPKSFYRFEVLSFDRGTGQIRWRQTAAEKVPHEGHHPTHSYAAGSPTTDGKSLYVSFGSFGIYCYDLGRQSALEARPWPTAHPARLGRGGHAGDSRRFAACSTGTRKRIRR